MTPSRHVNIAASSNTITASPSFELPDTHHLSPIISQHDKPLARRLNDLVLVGSTNSCDRLSIPFSVLKQVHPILHSMFTNNPNDSSEPLLDCPTLLPLLPPIHHECSTSISSRHLKRSQDKGPSSLSSNLYKKYYRHQNNCRCALKSPHTTHLNTLHRTQVVLANPSDNRVNPTVEYLRFGDNLSISCLSPINPTIVNTPPSCKSAHVHKS